jgi:hypothetical protein
LDALGLSTAPRPREHSECIQLNSMSVLEGHMRVACEALLPRRATWQLGRVDNRRHVGDGPTFLAYPALTTPDARDLRDGLPEGL